ncbi:MAG: glucan biosynthesis protein G [Proteobacteria bacterium]|nr:glucan biosynthesis protein G [Pseudomonadota bacterium]
MDQKNLIVLRSQFRRRLFLACCIFVLGIGQVPPVFATVFGFAQVQAKARKLLGLPYHNKPFPVPGLLRKLTPSQYAMIQDVDPLWHQEHLLFDAQFYLPGSYFKRPVLIHSVVNGQVQPIPFSPRRFTFGDLRIGDKLPSNMGYAGFRLLYPLNTPPHRNEFISFLGASYFRAVGTGQIYGTSARGLGIDTALPSGEIFPYFREFWLVKPHHGSRKMVVYALLDSKVATGAYCFTIHPGKAVTVGVKAVIYMRKPVQKLEIAPLTSMFWHGRGRGVRAGDWHPAQHDSSDLVMANGNGEWVTRPLNDPLYTQITSYGMNQPQGFGLIQQDRHFSSYEGLQTKYQLRPSVWVSFIGKWGKGHIQLVELPTNNRDLDNIDAFWIPEHQPAPGVAYHFNYRLRFFLDNPRLIPNGHPVATYIGDGKAPGSRQVVIDFAGPGLSDLSASARVHAVIGVDRGAKILNQSVKWDRFEHSWRVTATILPVSGHPSDVRCYLVLNDKTMSDTWLYLLNAAKE